MKNINKLPLMAKIKIFLFLIYVLVFYMFGADPNKVKYSEIILIIFLGLELIEVCKTKKIKYTIPILIMFIFTFYCYLSNFWATNAQLSINKAKTLFLLSTFLLVTYNFFINLEMGEDYILKVIMYAGIFFAIYVIMYYGIGKYFTKLMNGERVGEEIDNVNAIGLQTSISFIIAIFYALYDNKKIIILLALIPLIVALGTGSRKVIILIVLGIFLLFLLKKEEEFNIRKTIKKVLTFLIIVILFIYVSQLSIFSNIFNRLDSMLNMVTQNGKVDSSTKLRETYIKLGTRQFLQSPLFGIGVGNSGYITSSETKHFTYLHNNFVELLSTTGIVGFSLYYSVYIYIIFYCIKFLKKRNKYINITLIIFFINLVLEYGVVTYYSKTTYIYILLGLITIENERRKKINEQNNKID